MRNLEEIVGAEFVMHTAAWKATSTDDARKMRRHVNKLFQLATENGSLVAEIEGTNDPAVIAREHLRAVASTEPEIALMEALYTPRPVLSDEWRRGVELRAGNLAAAEAVLDSIISTRSS